ncbi:NAD(P)-binding protein [Mycobacterium ulcerans]|uniref:NAD(P)-binding protein n=1 Tax=Mycobacterium ulcerans TaxID=1809 RepID=UPI00214A9047
MVPEQSPGDVPEVAAPAPEPAPEDVTPLPDLLHGRHRAGPDRERRPVYVDLLPPCNAGCPAGENIQAWLAHARVGEHERAWRQLTADNPFAAIHGRVCYDPCESVCNRADLDASVSIHAVERFLGDTAREKQWRFQPAPQPTGKRVLVVGAGPSGLSAAYHLARLGHHVEVRDAGAEPGGMMRYGIPSYRLPRDVLDAEIKRIAALGVQLTTGHRVEDLAEERETGNFDAVFVAVGAHLAKRVNIPFRDARSLIDAVSFLHQVAAGEKPELGSHVAVYGGGNTAMDAARVARRLGAQDTVIIYRRTEAQMPAHEEERQDAQREGVQINWLSTITAFDDHEIRVEQMELDDTGRPRPTGRFETLAADTVIMALGQETESAFMRTLPGVEFDRDGGVGLPDADDRLSGCSPAAMVPCNAPSLPARRPPTTSTRGYGDSTNAHPSIRRRFRPAAPVNFGDAAAPVTELSPRTGSADSTKMGGLSAEAATFEAGHCLSCGNCFECDGCLGACPEDAVIKLGRGHRYRFDYDRCTGCATCYDQCPVHAIEMITEPR